MSEMIDAKIQTTGKTAKQARFRNIKAEEQ